jgi:hypothetical protein
MIAYSRESLLSVRHAASGAYAYLDSKLLAGIDACKNEIEAEFMGESSEPRGISSCSLFFSWSDHTVQTILRCN